MIFSDGFPIFFQLVNSLHDEKQLDARRLYTFEIILTSNCMCCQTLTLLS